MPKWSFDFYLPILHISPTKSISRKPLDFGTFYQHDFHLEGTSSTGREDTGSSVHVFVGFGGYL